MLSKNYLKIFSFIFVFTLFGCSFLQSEAMQEINSEKENLRTYIESVSEDKIYKNEDLDLEKIKSISEEIEKIEDKVNPNEKEEARNISASVKLFYYSEKFERAYAEDDLAQMKTIYEEIKTILKSSDLEEWASGKDEEIKSLYAELEDFIVAEEKFLDESVTLEEFEEYVAKADPTDLFNKFYKIIDAKVLFGSDGLELIDE